MHITIIPVYVGLFLFVRFRLWRSMDGCVCASSTLQVFRSQCMGFVLQLFTVKLCLDSTVKEDRTDVPEHTI